MRDRLRIFSCVSILSLYSASRFRGAVMWGLHPIYWCSKKNMCAYSQDVAPKYAFLAAVLVLSLAHSAMLMLIAHVFALTGQHRTCSCRSTFGNADLTGTSSSSGMAPAFPPPQMHQPTSMLYKRSHPPTPSPMHASRFCTSMSTISGRTHCSHSGLLRVHKRACKRGSAIVGCSHRKGRRRCS